MSAPTLNEQRPAFHLVADKTIEGEQFVTNFFNSLFDIKKLVLIKLSHKDKHLIREVVIILNSQNNIEMLTEGSLNILETKFKCKAIPVDDAEQLIRQNKTKLYVGNIPRGVDNIKLWKHFARFGALDYTYIIKKPDRNSRGFGFIIYEEREAFDRAVKSKHYIDGQRLICKLFLNKSQLNKNTKTDAEGCEEISEGCDGNNSLVSGPKRASQTSLVQVNDPQAAILSHLDDEDFAACEDKPQDLSDDFQPAKLSTGSTESSGKPVSSRNDPVEDDPVELSPRQASDWQQSDGFDHGWQQPTHHSQIRLETRKKAAGNKLGPPE